jgi:xanthosine utilization system XapX-like protein
LSIITAGVLLSPVFAFLMALVVAILLGLLMEVRVPAPLALGIAGAIGWFLFRKLWPCPPDNTSVQDEAGDPASAKLLTRDVSRRVAAPPGSRGPRRVDPAPNRALPARWRSGSARRRSAGVGRRSARP